MNFYIQNWLKPRALYEDNHVLAVFKPFRMPSQPDTSKDVDIFTWSKNFIKEKYNKKSNIFLALLHRLDRPVAGIMLFAKTRKAAQRITEQFKKQQVRKSYWAITYGVPNPKSGRLEHFLYKDTKKNKAFLKQKPTGKAKFIATEYFCQQTRKLNTETYSLIHFQPLTGRSHQLRLHAKYLKTPIVGDLKYGRARPLAYHGIALVAYQLEFLHPTQKKICCLKVANFPPHFPWTLF